MLQSKPEDRRAFIEEAAGVLKHRKRKEKALRKLDAMQANLTRLTDLTARAAPPAQTAGRQAEIARRAQAVQSELRDSRLRLAADDLVTLRDELAREEADESAARARRAEVEEQLTVARVEQERLEAALAAGRAAPGRRTGHLVQALGAGRAARAAPCDWPRSGNATLPMPVRPAPPAAIPTSWRPRPRSSPSRRTSWSRPSRRPAGRSPRSPTSARSTSARWPPRSGPTWLRSARSPIAGRASRRWPGGRRRMRSSATATAEEIERLSDALAEAQERTDAAQAELDGATDELGEGAAMAGDVAELEQRHRQAVEAHEVARRRVAELVAREREVEQQRAHWRARVDALSVGQARRDGSGALLDGDVAGVLGAVPGLITVEPWARTAVAAALGDLADAVAVESPEAAVTALRVLRAKDAGRAALLVGDPGGAAVQEDHFQVAGVQDSGFPELRWAAAAVHADGPLAGTVARLLAGVVIVDDLDAARAVVTAHPDLTAVTTDGDVLGAARAEGGSGIGVHRARRAGGRRRGQGEA